MNKIKTTLSDFALFNLGFRPFFLGAIVYSIITILFWMAIFGFHIEFPLIGLSSSQWHAHEMIFGYCMAVIAGFLLTAIKNWTGIQTVHGLKLMIIFSLWVIARILFLFGSNFMIIAAIFDLLFMISIIFAAILPIIQSHNWKYTGILLKILLLAITNLCFYLGFAGYLQQGIYWGLYGGLYLVIGLILMLGSKLIPFFIERGTHSFIQTDIPKWNTLAGILFFVIFFVSELFLYNPFISSFSAMTLFIIYSIRLAQWYTVEIWKKTLLWVLYLAMLFINIGFLLFALSAVTYLSKWVAIHALAYGGIGILTVGMMARVAYGHTGRDINEPPKVLTYTFILLLVGAVFRIFLPLFIVEYYLIWIIIAQSLWIIAFLLFLISFAPILTRPRIDGQFG